MNTRLQVEHGVTELVTGLDLVGLQFGIAGGDRLPFAQEDLAIAGHAVEIRLCAERPREGYRPTPGRVDHVRWPAGARLRVDSAVETGSVVSASYDSLVAKLMAHGTDRGDAVACLSRALRSLELDGLETNRELLQAVLDDPVFIAGEIDVHFLDRRTDLVGAAVPEEVRHRHAAAVAFRLLEERASRSLVSVPAAGWRNVGRPLHVDELRDARGSLAVRAATPGSPVSVQVGGEWLDVGSCGLTAEDHVDLLACADGLRRRYRVRLTAHQADVNGPEGWQSSFALRSEDDPDEGGGLAGECRAPLPGTVTKVLVAVGERVAEGEGLVVLEAMKMEHTLRADGAGTVARVECEPGQQVDVNDLLVVMEPA
jgi:acetyl/propionyl-CoA carboxylase alpha subunit